MSGHTVRPAFNVALGDGPRWKQELQRQAAVRLAREAAGLPSAAPEHPRSQQGAAAEPAAAAEEGAEEEEAVAQEEGAGEAAGGGQESRGVRRKKMAPWMGKHGHDGGEGCYKPDDEALQKLLLQSAVTQLQETEKVRCLWCGVRGSRRRARKHTCHLVWELRDGWDKWRRRMLLVEGNH